MYGPDALGMRRLQALLLHMPPEWGYVEELLAVQCELLDTTNRLVYGANYKGHVWKPLKIRRPDVEPPKMATPNEIHRFFTRGEALGNAQHSLS